MECDIAVVGAGVLGVTIAYLLSELHESSVNLVDQKTRWQGTPLPGTRG